MKQKYIHIIVLTLLLIATSACQIGTSHQKIEKAVIEIPTVADDSLYLLEDNWEFYFQKFIEPEAFKNYSTDTVKYVQVGNSWNDYKIDNKRLDDEGYATYHLRVIVPKGKTYALKFNRIYSAYNLWINDSLTMSAGKITTNKKDFEAFVKPTIISFKATQDTNDIVLHVSNFNYEFGGIANDVFFGYLQTVYKNERLYLMQAFFFFGIYIFVAFFFLFTSFIYNQNKHVNLFFGLSVLFSVVFNLTGGQMFLFHFLPNISWDTFWLISQASDFIQSIFAILFVYYLFKKEKLLNRWVVRIFTIIVTGLTICTFILPNSNYVVLYLIFLIIVILLNIYAAISMIILVFRKNKKAQVVALLYGVYICIAINDILLSFNVINSIQLLDLGLFIYTMSYTILLAYITFKVRDSYKKNLSTTRKFEEIQNKISLIKSFDLHELMKILSEELEVNEIYIFAETNGKLQCEAFHNFGVEEISYLQNPIITKLRPEFFEKIDKSGSNELIDDKFLTYKMTQEGGHRKYIYFSSEVDRELIIKGMKVLEYEISILIENYIIYYAEKNINKNFDTILEQRVEEIKKQEDVLLEQEANLRTKYKEVVAVKEKAASLNSILSEKNKELDSNIKNIEDLNKKILEQKNILTENVKKVEENLRYSKIIHNLIVDVADKTLDIPYFKCSIPKSIINGNYLYAKYIDNKLLIGLFDFQNTDSIALFFTVHIYSMLKDIVKERNLDLINNPEKLIKFLQENFDKVFEHNEDVKNFNYFVGTIEKDGFMKYCNDNILAYLVHENEIISLNKPSDNCAYNNYVINSLVLNPKDRVYLQTKGLLNQTRAADNEKFGLLRVESMLSELSKYNIAENLDMVKQIFTDWKKQMEQSEDYFIFGFDFEK